MKYLVPPRLNEQFKFFGCTVPELGLSGALLIFFVITGTYTLVFIPALILVSSIRFIEGENIRQYGLKVYCYYFKPQIFTMERRKKDGRK